MEFTVTDNVGHESGVLKEIKSLDIDIADKKQFTWQVRTAAYDETIHDYGCRIFCPGTEFGGVIGYKNPVTANGYIKLMGYTWRGIIDKVVVEPPSGQNYRVVSGEANAVISQLFGNQYSTLVRVSDENSGFIIKNHQINRDIHMLEVLENMLSPLNARIEVEYIPGPPNGIGYVLVRTVPIIDFSDTKEFSEDGKLNYNAENYRMGVNKLVCLGKGELSSRLRIYLYAWPDGTIRRTQYYTGLDCIEEVYDYPDAESEVKLIEGGTKRLKEQMNYKTFTVSIPDDADVRYDVNVGDIVGGRDRITGIYMSSPVINKIYKRTGRSEKLTYKLKGED